MPRKLTVSAAFVIMLASTTACTTYTSDGFFGGFSETPLAKNTYQIRGSGNKYASASLVRNIALVRAAELTLNNDFYSFIILDQDDWEKTSIGTIPSTYYSQPIITQSSKPITELVVRMFKAGEAGSENGLDPMEIIRTVGPKVKYEGRYLPTSGE